MRNQWALIPISLFFFVACGKEAEVPQPEVVRPVKTLVLVEGGASATRSYPGVVKANQIVDLAFQVAGPLVELPVKEGDRIEEGAFVARIRPDDFETRLQNAKGAIEEASSQLKAMQIGARPEEKRQLEAQLEASQAEFKAAHTQFVRYKKLYEEGVTPKTRFDEYEAAYGVARARLRAAHEELTKGLVGARAEDLEAKKAEIRGLEAAVKQADIDLRDTQLKSPFAGFVAKRYVENFQNVQAKQAIVSIQDISDVEVVINLPENDVVSIRKENIERIVAKFDALPEREFDLTPKEFSTEADPVTQTYPATLVMQAPEDVHILPGMTAKVLLTLKSDGTDSGSLFSVPSTAVFSEGEGANFAWIIDPSDMTATKVPVEIGALSGESIEVKAGLSIGDTVAISGVHHLREGMKVRKLED